MLRSERPPLYFFSFLVGRFRECRGNQRCGNKRLSRVRQGLTQSANWSLGAGDKPPAHGRAMASSGAGSEFRLPPALRTSRLFAELCV